MHPTSQEYLIKLPIGDSDFSLLLKLLFFHLNLSLNNLLYFYLCMCNPWRFIKGLYNIAKIITFYKNR